MRIFRVSNMRWVSAGFIVCGMMSAASCIMPHANAGQDADASVSAVRAEVREMSNTLARFESDMHAGGDISANDAWTLRLLGLGVMLLGLSYPIGKIVWLAVVALKQRTGGLKGASTTESGLREFLTLKECRADVLAPAGKP